MIRVLLADDQALVRAGFRALLDAEDDVVVVGEAGDGEEAVRQALEHRPDVVLMDIRMPGTDGLAATKTIAADERLEDVRVVILTTFGLDEYVFDAIRAGAAGFLLKDTEPAELIQAVRVVAGGEALLSPSITRRLIEEFAARTREAPPSGDLEQLTEREREVMGLVAAGRLERRDRGSAVRQPRDGEDPREPRHGEARRPRPRAARRVRVRVGPGRAGPRRVAAGRRRPGPVRPAA